MKREEAKVQAARNTAMRLSDGGLAIKYFPAEKGFLEGVEWADENPLITENTSDGYHTFKELYDFRLVYNAALFNELTKHGVRVIKSWRHSDGEKCFNSDDWFIVQAELPAGQVSNHYEAKYWDYFKVPEVPVADEWDGHTPQDVLKRLTDFVFNFQGWGNYEEKQIS